MKKIILVLLWIGSQMAATAQTKKDAGNGQLPAEDTVAPYLKFPTLPAFNLLLMDSTTIFNTYNIPEGKPTLLVFFSPDCKHCKAEMKELTKNMDSLQDVQFYIFTPVHSMTEIKNFYETYHLGDFKNIMQVGRDYEFFFGGFYHTKVVPDMALYDKNKNLIKLFEGNHHVTEIYNCLHASGK